MRARTIGAAAMVAVALSACGSSSGYPAAVQQSFTNPCIRAASVSVSRSLATAYCTATLACFKAHLSYSQLVAADNAVTAGRETAGTRLMFACAGAARKQVLGSGS